MTNRRARIAGLALTITLLCAGAVVNGQSTRDTLDVYLIDVEGGGATLFVTPRGESLLVDTGNGGANADRDVGRIMEAVTDAGLSQLDHLITTHWHGDHFGGLAELADRIPIRNYIDHGDNVQPSPLVDPFLEETYPSLYGSAQHTIVVPGDPLPLEDVDVRVVAAGGQVLQGPLVGAPGAGATNPYCASFVPQDPDPTENAQSVGIHLTFGEFRVLHLGDLTANKEFELMCPVNPLGTVDLWVVSHHGQPSSNARVLVHPVAPRVAIMNNGTRKGGQPEAMRVIHSAPGLEDLWQLHFSMLSGQEYTVPGLFIANLFDDQPPGVPLAPTAATGGGGPPPPAHNGPASWIKVSASRDGSFTVTNGRNGFSKTYEAD